LRIGNRKLRIEDRKWRIGTTISHVVIVVMVMVVMMVNNPTRRLVSG
jgi:hypothetical protein